MFAGLFVPRRVEGPR